ncbi:msx2-interacting protein-like [Protopterus annectens]|uniref:msx2-interacting protein-like n=1 Tax=Protopterus annectens TaxID=7888 RepID=UPI001CFC050A|nr:msx2-interacting protein-like [Protopterus annectens]
MEIVVKQSDDMGSTLDEQMQTQLGFGASKPSDFLWLGGLPENVTEEYLKEHFSKYGAVMQVVLDKEKRRALIHFADSKDTKTAFRESKQKKIGGKKVMVDFINQAGQLAFLLTMEESGQDISNAKSLLEKLQLETESKGPESQKAEASVVPEAKAKSVAESSESKTESRSKSAKLSSSTEKERNGAESDDNNLSVYQQSASCCLYATSLDSSYELADLRRLFRGFGQILGGDIKVIKGVRVAFLQFGDILGVLKAINKMNGRTIGSKKIKYFHLGYLSIFAYLSRCNMINDKFVSRNL